MSIRRAGEAMSRRLNLIARTRAIVLGITATTIPGSAMGSGVVYSYDKVGRLTIALYDNGTCQVYAYDANGNRTSQTNTNATAVWGTGIYGCFSWTP
jgi:YD repeat-containing protein